MTGTYTNIVIVAPDEAVAGEIVQVTTKIKNIWEYDIRIAADVAYDSIPFLHMESWVSPGETHLFSGSFIMPSSDVIIYAYSSYWLFGSVWNLDDEKTESINLAEAYKGTITKMELEYDGTYTTIPVSNVPLNERGLVHIWGRNDTASAQRMGISWVVKDPDDIVVEEYSTWEAWPYTGAGKDHEFIGGRFDLDKVGDYTIDVALSMNPDDPTYIDIYHGDLCTVAIAVPTFSDLEINFDKTIKV